MGEQVKTPFEQLPPGIRHQWKIDPARVLGVRRLPGRLDRWEALTDTHRYTWTYNRSRFDYSVNKKPL